MANVGTLVIGVTADIEKLTRGLSDAQSKIQAAGKGMIKAGAGLTAGVTAPLVGIGAASIKAATDMNESMANVQTLLTDMADGGAARTQELTTAVQDMATQTGKGTGDLAGGLYQTISAFGDTSDTVSILETNARAAAAGMATTEDAINLTSAVTKGYGDTSAEAVQGVADLAFQTVKLGQTTFPELASSMGRVVPLAASLGTSQEELFAVMATATGVTGDAAEVSTQLRGVLQSLSAPTETMAGLISDMGYSSGAAMLAQLGLQGTIDAVTGAAKDSGTPLQKYMGSVEAQTLALALAGPQADTFAEKLDAMSTAAGAADTAFAAQTEGVNSNGFAMQQLHQEMAVTAQVLGEALIPALAKAMEAAQPFIEKVVSLAEGFSNLDPKAQKIILGALGLAVVLGPVLMVVGGMVTAVGALVPLFSALAGAVGLLLSPIGLIALAIGGLLALMFNWGGANDWVAQKLEDMGLDKAAQWVRDLHDGVAAVVDTLGELFSGQMTFAEFFSAVVPGWIENLFNWAWPLLGPVAWVIHLMEWAWPRLDKPAWLNKLLNFDWPSFPRLPKWMGGGKDAGSNAGGTSHWRGGLTWVGEQGPELIDLPRGSRVFPADVSASMAGGLAGNVTINITATGQSEADMQSLAYRVVQEIQRRR